VPEPRQWQLRILPPAQKDLRRLTQQKILGHVERTLDRIQGFYRLGQPVADARPLKGRPASYRVDTGEYRVLYEVDEAGSTVIVFRVRHRREAYRNVGR
jgi:mRNA interferase RelE/StbE